jgi:two-component system, cell cycle response regulator
MLGCSWKVDMASPTDAQRLIDLEKENQTLRQEVERLRTDNRRWARMAGTDGLTGLPNKVSFLRVFAPQAVKSSAGARKPIGFILLSADELGPINETQGRVAGDQVLKGLAEFLQALLSEDLKLGHLDGSHFSVIMPEADLEAVKARANMLRARIKSQAFPCGDGVAKITTSVGILSAIPPPDVDEKQWLETVYGLLNGALYKAKSSGGNRVTIAENPIVENARRTRKKQRVNCTLYHFSAGTNPLAATLERNRSLWENAFSWHFFFSWLSFPSRTFVQKPRFTGWPTGPWAPT